VDDLTDMLHKTIAEMMMRVPVSNYTKSRAPVDVMFMHGLGVPIAGLSMQYRFDALLASVYAHDADAARALVVVSADVLDLDGGASLASALLAMQDPVSWRCCKCGSGCNQYAGFLVVAKWMHDNAARLHIRVRIGGQGLAVAFDEPAPPKCAKHLANHAVLRERRIEICALLNGMSQ
jgi:hypothetical protein